MACFPVNPVLRKLNDTNAKIYRESVVLFRPVPFKLCDFTQLVYVAPSVDSCKKLHLRSLTHHTIMVSGFSNEDMVFINRNNDNIISMNRTNLDKPRFEEIMDLDIKLDDTKCVVTGKITIDVVDIEKNMVCERLSAVEFPLKTKYNPKNPNVLACASKDQLVLYDSRDRVRRFVNSNRDFGNAPLQPSINIKRKSTRGQPPATKPSDMIWYDDRKLFVSNRSVGQLKVFDIRYLKDGAMRVKESEELGGFKGGIEQMKLDDGSGIVYGMNYRSGIIKCFTPDLVVGELPIIEEGFQGKDSCIEIIKDPTGTSSLVQWGKSGDKSMINCTPLPLTCGSLLYGTPVTKRFVVGRAQNLDNVAGDLCHNPVGRFLAVPFWNNSREVLALIDYVGVENL